MQFKSVSRVAQELSAPQPTISRSLAHLREHFKDPLFVATRSGMEPTPHALSIMPTVQKIVELLQSHIAHNDLFRPERSRRQFAIAASDTGHLLLLPKLINLLADIAPNVTLDAAQLSEKDLIRQLETGEVDIAFGGFPNLYANVKEQRLFSEHYVCFARMGHPTIKESLSAKQFLDCDHIIISAHGMGHVHRRVEKELIEYVGKDKVKLTLHSFQLGALIAEQVDALLTVPSQVAHALGKRSNLKEFTPPLELPGFEVKQYWHERFDKDPANKWLRSILYKVYH